MDKINGIVDKVMLDLLTKVLSNIQSVLQEHNDQLKRLWTAVDELERRTHGKV